jgi:hypothetical protein
MLECLPLPLPLPRPLLLLLQLLHVCVCFTIRSSITRISAGILCWH